MMVGSAVIFSYSSVIMLLKLALVLAWAWPALQPESLSCCCCCSGVDEDSSWGTYKRRSRCCVASYVAEVAFAVAWLGMGIYVATHAADFPHIGAGGAVAAIIVAAAHFVTAIPMARAGNVASPLACCGC